MAIQDFLKATLGEPGANAMEKSIQKLPQLSSIVVPQTVLCWVQNQTQYNAVLPGNSHVHVLLTKSENTYMGRIMSPGINYPFEKSSAKEVAVAISLTLGITDFSPNKKIRHTHERLSKTIESLFLSNKQLEITLPVSFVKVFNHELYKNCNKCNKKNFVMLKNEPLLVGCDCNASLAKNESSIKNYGSYTKIEFGKGWTPDVVHDFIKTVKGN
jgi:hypothetical protein